MSDIQRKLEDKVVLVSGAGSGIGEASALAFARAGAKLVLTGRRKEPLEATASRIGEIGETLVVLADMSVAADVQHVMAVTLDRFGRLDCALNNAGIQGPMLPIVDMPEADFDAVVATNLKGVWLAIKYAVRAMMQAGAGGAIVNTSSFLSSAANGGQRGLFRQQGRARRDDPGGCARGRT